MRESTAAIRKSKNTLSNLSSSFSSAINRERRREERENSRDGSSEFTRGKEGRADDLISVKCFVSPTLVNPNLGIEGPAQERVLRLSQTN